MIGYFLSVGSESFSIWIWLVAALLGTEAGDAMKVAETSTRPPSFRLKLGGTIARTIFILLLMVLTARVASPQVEKLKSVLETPDDFIRVLLGFAVCIWCIVNLFILPKDAEAYRVWIYLGLAIVPLSVLCAVVVW